MNTFKYGEIEIGDKSKFSVRITDKTVKSFLDITGDVNPLHTDAEFARSKGFKDKVVYGMLTASFLSTLAGVYIPGKNSLIHSTDIKFLRPVFIGDELTIEGIVAEKNDLFKLINVKI